MNLLGRFAKWVIQKFFTDDLRITTEQENEVTDEISRELEEKKREYEEQLDKDKKSGSYKEDKGRIHTSRYTTIHDVTFNVGFSANGGIVWFRLCPKGSFESIRRRLSQKFALEGIFVECRWSPYH